MSTFKSKKDEARRGKISSAKLLSTSALTAAGLLAFAMNPARADDIVSPETTTPETTAPAWTDFTTEEGDATFETPTDTLTNITQNTSLYVGTSPNLDIPEGYHVNIDQASSDYLFVAKAAPDADPTYILGRLTADGRVIIIDRNGVFTGKDSVIDVAGIITTTGDIAIEDLKANDFGDYEITNITDGKIDLNGTVTVASAGLAAFVAPSVSNSGVINAHMGKVAFASGEVVTLDLYGDKLVEIAVPGNKADALIENSGAINAEGGTVVMSAAQAKDVVDNIINVSGIVDVSSVSQAGGKIVLSGGSSGKVTVSGILDATGVTGGDIEVTGQFVSAEDNAVLDASGTNGGGTIHFGGDWQGQGDTPTSEYAFVGQDAILNANSEEDGDGGEVVVWSDKVTGFFGLITAKGGANGGNGGQVETSGKDTLFATGSVDASAANGIGGEWLLDPRNLEVRDNTDADINNAAGVITTVGTANGNTSFVTDETIEASLNAGTSVTLRTGDQDDGQGDITVSQAIAKTGNNNATLRMESHDDININSDITASGNGLLNILLLAGFDESSDSDSGNNDVNFGANVDINTNGGDLEVGADRDITGNASSSILTEGGRVTMVAGGGTLLHLANHTVTNPLANSDVLFDGDIDTDGGQVFMNAGDDIRIGGAIVTDGGAATFIAEGDNSGGGDALGDVEFKSGSSLNTTAPGPDGNVFISAENFINAGYIIATTGTVNLGRSTLGTIDVGDNNGSGYNISQNELFRIIAGGFVIGDNNTTNVTVDNVDMFSQFTSTNDQLPQPSQGCENSSGGNPNCVQNFEMRDSNLTLKATALVDIIGPLTMGTGWVTVDAPELDLDTTINGKATINGAATPLGDARLIGTQQLVNIDVLSNDAKIQQAIDFADSTAQKEIDVAQDTYTENLVVNKGNLKLDGSNATVQAASNANNALVFVTASNVNIDPFIFDGNFLVNYGVSASNAGANGLVVDGNTFREFNVAGIHVDNNTGGTSTLKNNIIEGSMPVGIELGVITGGSVVDIFGNDIGTLGDRVDIDGIQINAITGGADVNIYDNDIFATLDGVYVDGDMTGAGTTLLVAGNRIDASQDGVDIDYVTGGASVTIGGADRVVGGLVGSLLDNGNTIKAGTNGIEFDSGVDSTVTVSGNKIAAGVDGINIRDEDAGHVTGVDGGTVTISNNDIGSDGADVVGANGIHFIDSITNGAIVSIAGNNIGRVGARVDNGVVFEGINGAGTDVQVEQGNVIFAEDDGVVVNGDINGVETFAVESNTINANQHGVAINGNVTNAQDVQVNVNNITANGGHGVFFNGNLTNSLVIVNSNTNINAEQDGVRIGGNIVGGNTQISQNDNIVADDHGIYVGGTINGGAALHIHDNVITANDDNGVIGSGIYFNGTITNATVNIGNGDNYFNEGNPSNIITVADNGFGSDDNLDGIHFHDTVGTGAVINIDGNRIGMTGTPGVSGSEGNFYSATDDGIEFRGAINGNADINISDTTITADDDGIRFNGAVGGTATITIGDGGLYSNDIQGNSGHGIVFESTVGGQAQVDIVNNMQIRGGLDGIAFEGATSNALLPAGASQQEINISGNNGIGVQGGILGGNNGIRFAANVDADLHDIRIAGNRIIGNTVHGINFNGNIGGNESQVWIADNSFIRGAVDGIHFNGTVSDDATVEITGNTWIQGLGDDGIDFVGNINNATVRINNNHDIVAADNGIEFLGVNGGTVEILANNAGITSNNHGIYFGAAINGGADLDIHDNIIEANADNSGGGDGIRFDGTIADSTVNIGDGLGSSLDNDASNVISGVDGIHFDANIGDDADIVIDGNRIGYSGPRAAPTTPGGSRVSDDGISFASVSNDADIRVTDNWIRSNDDGIVFNNNVDDEVYVLIGGDNQAPDGNHIDANGDGVQFSGDITENALIEISYNFIDADEDGIVVFGDTSNADTVFPFRDDEILIANNDIVGGDNGINFEGRASGDRHDIRIEDNDRIIGNGGQGINHTGGIDGSELWILDNDEIYGSQDGIHLEGFFFNGAHIEIDGNDDVDSGTGDGIEVTDTGLTGGSDVNITDNHVHFTGDNGIEVSNVDDVFIAFNDVHDTGNNGIDVDNSEDAQIRWNDIWDTDEDGIYVEDSDDVNIEDNDITDAGDDGIDVRNSDDAEIEDNFIWSPDGDGIQVRDSNGVDIDDNFIRFAGDDGIDFENGNFSSIEDNDIRFSQNNGIEVEDSNFIVIDNNLVQNSGDAGIYVDPSAFIMVANNTLRFNEYGVRFDDVWFSEIVDNVIEDNRVAGIRLNDSHVVGVLGNEITGNGRYGLWADGGLNGYINVTGNQFLDNPTHARFESGIIDLTNVDPVLGYGNTFIGGNIGLEFDVWNNQTQRLSLVREGGFFVGGYTYDGNPYDTFNGTTVYPPTNFGGTIGEQYFEDQSQYFVAVRSDTFVEPRTGNAVWLDASDSTYFAPFGTFSPADTGDVLTQQQFDFLEERFRHWPDANNRGIFWFGFVPSDTLSTLKDPIYDPYDGGVSGLNVTITGLPRLTGPVGTPPISSFNAISPAAGDEEGGTTTTADLANIEPAAGGSDSNAQAVNCWGDAVSAAGTGAPVSYSYGGSFEESIAAAASCGAQSF